jgi:ATP-binding cassette, subfamily C (CFTR/MRP), member 1
MSLSGRSESTLGQIQNLMSTDSERVQDAGFNLLTLYMAPVQLLGSLVWLYLILGVSSLIGLLVLFIFTPIAGKTAGKLFSYQMQKMEKADERVKTVNEMLLGIRIIKYYVWEHFFHNSIGGVRKEEIGILNGIPSLLLCVPRFSFIPNRSS